VQQTTEHQQQQLQDGKEEGNQLFHGTEFK